MPATGLRGLPLPSTLLSEEDAIPANLTPEFLKTRERLCAAQTMQEKLAALEEMLATIPKHKGTDKMQADIKRRIAKLRAVEQLAQKKGYRARPHRPRGGWSGCAPWPTRFPPLGTAGPGAAVGFEYV